MRSRFFLVLFLATQQPLVIERSPGQLAPVKMVYVNVDPKSGKPWVSPVGALVVQMYCNASITRDEWEPCKGIKDGEHFVGHIPAQPGSDKHGTGLLVLTAPSPIGTVIPTKFDIYPGWTDKNGDVK